MLPTNCLIYNDSSYSARVHETLLIKMVKRKYAERGKPKPKSIKSKAKLSAVRKLSRFGVFSRPSIPLNSPMGSKFEDALRLW